MPSGGRSTNKSSHRFILSQLSAQRVPRSQEPRRRNWDRIEIRHEIQAIEYRYHTKNSFANWRFSGCKTFSASPPRPLRYFQKITRRVMWSSAESCPAGSHLILARNAEIEPPSNDPVDRYPISEPRHRMVSYRKKRRLQCGFTLRHRTRWRSASHEQKLVRSAKVHLRQKMLPIHGKPAPTLQNEKTALMFFQETRFRSNRLMGFHPAPLAQITNGFFFYKLMAERDQVSPKPGRV